MLFLIHPVVLDQDSLYASVRDKRNSHMILLFLIPSVAFDLRSLFTAEISAPGFSPQGWLCEPVFSLVDKFLSWLWQKFHDMAWIWILFPHIFHIFLQYSTCFHILCIYLLHRVTSSMLHISSMYKTGCIRWPWPPYHDCQSFGYTPSVQRTQQLRECHSTNGAFQNGGTPKWMVYHETSYENAWFLGYPHGLETTK